MSCYYISTCNWLNYKAALFLLYWTCNLSKRHLILRKQCYLFLQINTMSWASALHNAAKKLRRESIPVFGKRVWCLKFTRKFHTKYLDKHNGWQTWTLYMVLLFVRQTLNVCLYVIVITKVITDKTVWMFCSQLSYDVSLTSSTYVDALRLKWPN